MNKEIQQVPADLSKIAGDAQTLMSDTAAMAGEKVDGARKSLAAALTHSREICDRLREKALISAKAADKTVHEHPYMAMSMALGAGALLGYLISRRCSNKCK